MAAPIARKTALVGITVAMGIAMLVNAGPTVTSDTQRSVFDQTTDVTTPLSPVEKTRAEAWDLSDIEWRRYQALMDGIRSSISPATLSPIEVLGIHARDEGERRRYAERWARLMRDDAERILAFQRAYDRAWQRLFPAEPLIDLARLPDEKASDVALQPNDRVLFFTRPDCASCDVLLQRLLKRIDTLAGVDIYLLGLPPDDDTAARDWAERQSIAPRWVRSRRVTLNHDGGALSELTQGKGQAPYLLRRRGDVLSVLSGSAL
ncbi:MAG: TIGR03759 family integrating conjugative element protein [Chromatiaceae bacterium]|nr:TIGR03759 family integrating conjugative element protein [Chromatiaceae bacterium]